MIIHSKLLQAIIGFTSLEDYLSRILIPFLGPSLKIKKPQLASELAEPQLASELAFELAEPDDISCMQASLPSSVSMESEPIEVLPLNTVQIERPLQAVKMHAVRPKKRDWNRWAKSNGLKDNQAFRIRYKKEACKITGIWRGDKYFLVTDRVAPIPPGREAEAEKHGWGLPVIYDCPTRVVALVKMSYGAPLINKGHGAAAQPYELEMLLPHGRWAAVYKAW